MRKHALLFAFFAVTALTSAALTIAPRARAGGGPANVMVLYNADDPDATAVAKHYETARSLPAGHLCGVKGIDKNARTIDAAKFKELVQKPLDACIAASPQPDELDYLVTVRGLPYLVTLPRYAASLDAVLQVMHATSTTDGSEIAGAGAPIDPTQPGTNDATILNPTYVGGPAIESEFSFKNPYDYWYGAAGYIARAKDQPTGFSRAMVIDKPAIKYKFAKNLLVVSRLDAFDYKDANDLIDRAIASESGTFPTAEILCMHAEDDARGARDPECELTVRLLKGAGLNGVWVDKFDGKLAGHTIAAYFSGSASTISGAIAGNTYVPGAITDNLTSTGADPTNFFCSADGKTCPAGESQTSIARYIRAGASGAHGAVTEPLNNIFPNAGALLLYTFGYSMGESYLFNQRFLYWQNQYLGDPLMTPYAVRPTVVVPKSAGKGQPMTIKATHPDGIAAMRVYIAGKRVAESTADTVDVVLPGDIGSKSDVLAVAIAKNAPVKRVGWKTVDQQPHPDVQGWKAASVDVVEKVADPDSGVGADGGPIGDGGDVADAAGPAASGGSQDSAGCSCRTTAPTTPFPRSVPIVLDLGVFAVLRRSRMRRDVRGTGANPSRTPVASSD